MQRLLVECEEEEGNIEEENKGILLEPKPVKMENEAKLSIHAMEGSTSPKTIKLIGQINRKPVSILLDTGSTHNFVDPRVVKRTGLKVIPESEGICKAVQVKCQGDITTDFHILPIGGYQMVLGIAGFKL